MALTNWCEGRVTESGQEVVVLSSTLCCRIIYSDIYLLRQGKAIKFMVFIRSFRT